MESSNIEEELSDDEIHFGKLTIQEIKKILCNGQGSSKLIDVGSKNDPDSSFRLIETHSQPNLRSNTADSPDFPSQLGSPILDRNSDQSFIQIENMVSKLCTSPRNSDNVELNNTLEVIDYILKHGPNHNNAQDPVKNCDTKEVTANLNAWSPLKVSPEKLLPLKESLKAFEKPTEIGSPSYYTPVKSVTKKPLSEFVTPLSKTPVFKTPANPISLKKPSTPRFTPGKTNAYQHITSPIASYIKNCPQAPLVKDVHPKKPLPASSIPKFVRNPSQSKIHLNKNKENTNLPSIAYKSAKKTKVIQLPDENKLPQSQWVKKITSSFPRPTVMRHENREMNPVKKQLLLNQENSFANLSCHQAEVSVCTEKTAFKSTNKY